jgi:hypothetical protein
LLDRIASSAMPTPSSVVTIRAQMRMMITPAGAR